MDIRDRRALKHTAAERLASARGNPGMVVLVHAGISCLLSLAITVISYILNKQIDGTGGLSNMGLRSILSTGQTLLPLVQLVVMLGLELGYTRCALNIARGRPAEPRMLPEGYYRFGPMLRAMIIQSIMYFFIGMGSAYLSCYIFLLLPLAAPFYELVEPILSSSSILETGIVLDEATLGAMTEALIPMVIIWGVVFVLMLLPIHYQYRMVNFCLADDSRIGAMAALRQSRNMMRRNRFALFRLDLSMWWYYLLQLLVTVICYGDVLLPLIGVTLPFSETVAYFLFLILSLIAQMAVAWFAMNRVNVTYAMAYESLRPKPQTNGGTALGNIFNM